MEHMQEATEVQPLASLLMSESRDIGVFGQLPSFEDVFGDFGDVDSIDLSFGDDFLVPSSPFSLDDLLCELGTDCTSDGVVVASYTGMEVTGGRHGNSQVPGGSDTSSLPDYDLPDVVMREVVEELCEVITESESDLETLPATTPDMATSDVQSDFAPSDFEPSDIDIAPSSRNVQVVQPHIQLHEKATTPVTLGAVKRVMDTARRGTSEEIIHISSDEASSPLEGVMESADTKRTSSSDPPRVEEAEIGDDLMKNLQWYHERPKGMTVRRALARVGLCATELVMRGVKQFPDLCFQKKLCAKSQNPWWVCKEAIKFVMTDLGGVHYYQAGYKSVHQNLHYFSSTDAFLEHSLDHGEFSPCQREQQNRAEELRRKAGFTDEKRDRCPFMVTDAKDYIERMGTYPVYCYRKGRRAQSSGRQSRGDKGGRVRRRRR